MMKENQVVVVDFKFGKENPKYNKQVKGYMQLLSKMGYENITGYLWYVDEERIEKYRRGKNAGLTEIIADYFSYDL